MSRGVTNALLHEVTDAPLLSREATTALSHEATDAPSEGVGVVCSGIGWVRLSGCVGVAGSLSREATTALSREVTDAPGGVGEGRQPRNGVVWASGLQRASAMATRAAAGRGAVGARVAVWERTRPG